MGGWAAYLGTPQSLHIYVVHVCGFGEVARARVRVLPYANKYDPPPLRRGGGGECANYRLDEK